MLGTGHATVTRCYNTCFLIDNDGKKLLVDAGGGNGILTRLEQCGVDIREIGGVFVTHAHTDHLLGVVWVIRKAIADMLSTGKNRILDIYCPKKCAEMLRYICANTLFSGYLTLFDKCINFVETDDKSRFSCAGIELTAFDVHSDKIEQLGFKAVFSDGFTRATSLCTIYAQNTSAAAICSCARHFVWIETQTCSIRIKSTIPPPATPR